MKKQIYLPKKYVNSAPDKIDAKESDYLYVSESHIPGAGKGLFTSISIYKDEIISVFKGEMLSDDEAKVRAKNGDNKYFINMPDGTIMDSMNVKCFAKYANDAHGLVKTKFKINSRIILDNYDNVCVVANRDIIIGEEVYCNYGKQYWKKFKLNDNSYPQ
jgi:uncharacterized protein